MYEFTHSHRGYELQLHAWPMGMWEWMHETFGRPVGRSDGRWDSYDVWLFIYNEADVTLFLLKWSK